MELETQRPCEECQRKQDLIDTFEMEANAASANQDEDEKAWHEFMGGPHYATPTLREAWDAAIAHARNRKLLNPTLPHKPAQEGKTMELETINKLYLELSQIATAKTAREIELESLLTTAKAITERKGAETDWKRFSDRLANAGIGSVTDLRVRQFPKL